MSALVLLGAWNELPLAAWPWFSDIATDAFRRLTGVKLRVFTYVKDELHYQYLFAEGTEKLHNHIESLSKSKQIAFIKRIYDNYFSRAQNVAAVVESLNSKKGYRAMSRDELVNSIQALSETLSVITMHIWFALLLDIWYPSLKEKSKLKSIPAKARDHSGHLHDRAKKILKELVSELARKAKVKNDDLYYLFPEELNNLDAGIAFVAERKKLCVTTNIRGGYAIFQGKAAEGLLKKYVPEAEEPITASDVLQGMAASPGHAQGKARVVLLHNQFKEFREGEILVALQTMVNYVPIMRKSAAIITEFGGVTSHAAIVSRELRKPCVINVKGATKIIKTGYLVEVDANKGIIRIVKRA